MLQTREKKARRHRRVRAKISGTAERPRLCVFRSSQHIYAQLINDEKNKTMFSADDRKLPKHKAAKEKAGSKDKPLSGKNAIAFEVGRLIAKKALEKNIKKIVFDRAGYKYFGRIKALADGARTEGLKF